MPNNTLTFEIGGQIELKDLEKGISLFTRLVNALTPRNRVAWVVHDLQPGSARLTLEGKASDEADVERVVRDYEIIGRHISNGTSDYAPTGFANGKKRAMKAAYAIRDFASSGAVEYWRFETESDDFTIYPIDAAPPHASSSISIGEVTGRVQTLSNRGGLTFTLYEDIYDKAVACYLQSGREDIMREAWGRRANVIGVIKRDAIGKPMEIREIADVELLAEVPPDAYKQARGAIPWKPGDMRPEEVIRKMRDAW